MTEIWKPILTALIPGLILSGITAYITVRLSLKQFAKQRLWEKKVEIYSKILEQLSNIQYYYETKLNKETGHTYLRNTEDEKFQYKKLVQTVESLIKTQAISLFIISTESNNYLKKLINDLEIEDPEGGWTDCDARYKSVTECIDAIINSAKNDTAEGSIY